MESTRAIHRICHIERYAFLLPFVAISASIQGISLPVWEIISNYMHRGCISIPLKNYQPHYSKGSLSTSIDLEEVKQLIPKQGVGNKIVINGNKAWYFIREGQKIWLRCAHVCPVCGKCCAGGIWWWKEICTGHRQFPGWKPVCLKASEFEFLVGSAF